MASVVSKDEDMLKQQLASTLGWDSSVVEGVVGAIVSATGKAGVEDVITNFMGGDPTARALVEGFLAKQARERVAARKGGVGAAPAQQTTGSAGGQPQGARLGSSHLVMQEYQRQPTAGMRQGGSIQARVAKPKGRGKGKGAAGGVQEGGGEGEVSAGRTVVRSVVNCLGCGKIYDIRDTRTDTQLFLESGGRCTFCGDEVPSLYGDIPAAASQPGSTGEMGSSDSAALNETDVTAALELKDRLVEYDRNSAKRTSVIDDQSDYFAIDNVWLDDTERRVLLDRQRLIEEAEAERGSRITVVVDLMGRQVVLGGDDDDGNPARSQPGNNKGAGGFGFTSATDDLRQKIATATEATAPEIPQGGGSAVLDAERHALRDMRISANPQLNGAPSPLFLPRAKDAPSHAATSSKKPQQPDPTASSKENRKAAASARAKPPRRRAVQRLQHDDPFDSITPPQPPFAQPETFRGGKQEGGATDSSQEPFDVCMAAEPHDVAPDAQGELWARAISAIPPRGTAGVEVLGDGLLLLRRWLSISTQTAIVAMVRGLGLGKGGFYTPTYTGGGRLRLRMMCLGQHWEPRTAQYEHCRSSYDGATPPPIPAPLLSLVQRAMADATAAACSGVLPAIIPDICLCNFYEKQGRLGMHQDRDESSASLRAGIPVVSFSIGDAAEFVYGSSRDESSAKRVLLESGDVIIFGGASRMIFHGVTGIRPGTAPRELVDASHLRPGRLNLTFRQL